MSLAMLSRRWPIDHVLLRREWKLTRDLLGARDSGFRLVYADWSYVLFVSEARLGPRADELTLRWVDVLDGELHYVEALSPAGRDGLRRDLAALRAVRDDNALARETALALLLSEGRWAEAWQAAEGAGRRSPATLYERYVGAVALSRLGRDAEALPRFRALLAREPGFERAYPALGEVALRLGRAGEAREALEGYLVRREYFLGATEYALLGNARYQDGARAASAEAYERALLLADEGHPDLATIETNLASAYLDLGRPADAASLLESALRRRRPFPEAEYNLGRAWLRLGRAEDARRILERLAADDAAPAALRQRARDRLAGR
jgi:tetratricopeptide (TPR) repeat protein